MPNFQNITCYYPAGNKAAYNGIDFVPCKKVNAPGVSPCCNPADICTATGYCVGSAGAFYRGACTDQTWTSSQCPELCSKVKMDDFANFFPCVSGFFTTKNWSCDGGGSTANVCPRRMFDFSTGALFAPYAEPESAAATVTVTGSLAPTNPIMPTAASDSMSRGTAIGIGAGVGAGLAVVAIVALIAFARERKRRKAAEKLAAQAHQPQELAGEPKYGPDHGMQAASSYGPLEIGSSAVSPWTRTSTVLS